MIVMVEDPPKSYRVGCLQSRCSSAATAVQLMGMTLGGEGEAYVNCDAGHDQVLATCLLDRRYDLRIIPRADDHRYIREHAHHFWDKRAVRTLAKVRR
jgi:hypothetical protein